jgi:hypothetical protein
VTYDIDAYRGRSVVERSLNAPKHWRGLPPATTVRDQVALPGNQPAQGHHRHRRRRAACAAHRAEQPATLSPLRWAMPRHQDRDQRGSPPHPAAAGPAHPAPDRGGRGPQGADRRRRRAGRSGTTRGPGSRTGLGGGALDRCRRQPATVSARGVLRRVVRRESDRSVLRPDTPPTSEPRRRPAGQRCPLPHRLVPPALGPANPGLPATQDGRRTHPP